MNTTLTLMDLAGAIALLIWGVHMVQTGITRAFGPQLRRILGYALGSRFKAFLAGLGVTAVLQSSTATGLMTTAFAAGGLVDLVPALAVMLGANVGTTLIVQVLSFDVSRVSFLFILLGVFMFRRSGVTRTRDLGRVGIGLGLMLIALQHLLAMITPYEDVPSLRILLGAVTTEPVIDILIAAGLTWAAHSSVAVVLLIMAFAAQGVVPPHAAFALVLGANLGTALNPLLESGVGGDPAAKRLPIGNLINRVVGCALALALSELDRPGADHARAQPHPRRGRFSHRLQHCSGAAVLPVAEPVRSAARASAAGARRHGRSVAADLSRLGSARDPQHRARRRRARSAAHGRRVRGHASRRARFAQSWRSQASHRNRAHGYCARPARHRDQGVFGLDRHRLARRYRSPAFIRNPRIYDQPRACRRHRREEFDAACRQAHQTRRQLLGEPVERRSAK